jgi:hypothetical protein
MSLSNVQIVQIVRVFPHFDRHICKENISSRHQINLWRPASHIHHQLAVQILSSPSNYQNSWFHQLRDICKNYSIPHPLQLLSDPPSSSSFKNTCKKKFLDFWNRKLCASASGKDSLILFKAGVMSLTRPHPIWTSAGCSSYEVRKATVQARMLSGRYRTCWLRRHWSGDSSGHCRIPGCRDQLGTLQHLATGECPGLSTSLVKATTLWSSVLKDNPVLFPIIKQCSIGPPDAFLAFLVGQTTQSPVISLTQTHGTIISEKLCYMTRTWLFQMHKERLKLLNLWK